MQSVLWHTKRRGKADEAGSLTIDGWLGAWEMNVHDQSQPLSPSTYFECRLGMARARAAGALLPKP